MQDSVFGIGDADALIGTFQSLSQYAVPRFDRVQRFLRPLAPGDIWTKAYVP